MNLLSITKALGQRIRYFRKLRKMSQALLGALMHVSQQVIAKYESGRAMLPAIRVPSLCEALDITTVELFAGLPRFKPVRMGRRARLTATRADLVGARAISAKMPGCVAILAVGALIVILLLLQFIGLDSGMPRLSR